MNLPAPVTELSQPTTADWREVVTAVERALGEELARSPLRRADTAPGDAVRQIQPIPAGVPGKRLLLLSRGGTLNERREAVRRLGDVLAGKASADDVGRREVATRLAQAWDPDIAYELTLSLQHASGGASVDAVETMTRTHLLTIDLVAAIQRYWDGTDPVDPVLALLPEERMLVGVFCRDMPDLVVSHLAELLVGLLRAGAVAPLREVAFALIPAGDARILPALVRLLEDGAESVRLAAARALGRIEDPRAPAALARALEGEKSPEARTVIGGALALAGDRRAAEEIRSALGSPEGVVVEAALEGLATAGEKEDVKSIAARLDPAEPALAVAAAFALERVGDASALVPLETALARAELPAVRTALAEASAVVRARCALAGETTIPAIPEPSAHASAIRTLATVVRPRATLYARLRSWVRSGWGRTLHGLGLVRAAARQFGKAGALNPRRAMAPLREGQARLQRGEHEEALDAFRRAIAREPDVVAGRRDALADLVRVYLRESTRLEEASLRTQARQTLDELLALDLGNVPLPLRLELARRREVLRRS